MNSWPIRGRSWCPGAAQLCSPPQHTERQSLFEGATLHLKKFITLKKLISKDQLPVIYRGGFRIKSLAELHNKKNLNISRYELQEFQLARIIMLI